MKFLIGSVFVWLCCVVVVVNVVVILGRIVFRFRVGSCGVIDRSCVFIVVFC